MEPNFKEYFIDLFYDQLNWRPHLCTLVKKKEDILEYEFLQNAPAVSSVEGKLQ